MTALKLFALWTLPPALSVWLLACFFRDSPRRTAWAGGGAAAVVAAALFLAGPGPAVFAPLAAALVCSGGIAAFLALFSRAERHKLGHWLGQLQDFEAREQEEDRRRRDYKKELDRAEREVVRTLRLYGAMKGMGEGITWDDMVPHIDYAVKQCMGLPEYQLYLLDDNSQYQKVITRGFHRFLDAPLKSLAGQPKLHQTANETYLETPIKNGDAQIGVLWARIAATHSVPKEDLLVEALDLSEGLGMGLQKARLFSSLEKLSRIDGLTLLHRRQVFNERLNEEIRRTRVFHTVFSVLIADVDHFKSVNDTYGHQAGDEVLRRVGRILKESVYETDLVARYGGEEFVILFPQSDPAGVLRKAEAVRARVAQELFVLGWHKIRVTISMGVAHFPQDGSDAASLLERADQALYAAKNGGRDRVVDSSQI